MQMSSGTWLIFKSPSPDNDTRHEDLGLISLIVVEVNKVY